MPKRSPLLIISSRLPPQFCGVGTYSWLLHEFWPEENAGHRFLVIDGAAESIAVLNFPGITEFNANPAVLSNALHQAGAADVFLHYAGRAYHRYGCPAWLPRTLQLWKEKFPKSRLTILFHELPGEMPVTSRHYWLNIWNRRIIGKLASLADLLITNTSDHASKLKKISGRKDVYHFPVGSNIPVSSQPSQKRVRTEFVVFGLPFGRRQTLELFDGQIREWRGNGILTKLHVIGPADPKFDRQSDELAASYPNVVVRHGELPADAVSQLLSQAQFALSNVDDKNWGKSGALMAYASHGCAVVTRTNAKTEPLSFTVLPDEVGKISESDLEQRRESLRQWFHENADWRIIARKISALMAGQETKAR